MPARYDNDGTDRVRSAQNAIEAARMLVDQVADELDEDVSVKRRRLDAISVLLDAGNEWLQAIVDEDEQ